MFDYGPRRVPTLAFVNLTCFFKLVISSILENSANILTQHRLANVSTRLLPTETSDSQKIWTICSLATPDPFSATTQPEQEIDIHQRTSQMDGVRTRNATPVPQLTSMVSYVVTSVWRVSQAVPGIIPDLKLIKPGMLIHDTRLYMACQFSFVWESASENQLHTLQNGYTRMRWKECSQNWTWFSG